MRQKDWVWKYYYTDDSFYQSDKTHKNAWCQAELDLKKTELRQADQASRYRGEEIVERDDETLTKCALHTHNAMCGKVNQMIKHLLECDHVAPDTKIQVQKHQSRREELRSVSQAILKSKGDCAGVVATKAVSGAALPPIISGRLSEQQQEEFNRDLCDVFVACGFSWNEVGNPVLKRFYQKWIPAALVPNRQTLSGRVLPERVAEVETQARRATRGKLAMGQCDGWKNIARNPLVGMMMTVQNQTHILRVHHIGAERKTAENLLVLIKQSLEEGQTNYGVSWIGWCTDAGGDSRKARKLLFAEFPELICPDCSAHQMNLLVGDYLKIEADFIAAASKAQTLIKWVNNHSRALEWLHVEQQHSLQKTLSLIYPATTRWTSVYMSLKRLLDCLPAFRGLLNNHTRMELRDLAGTDRKARDKALRVVDIIGDKTFWTDIHRISLHLEPLTVAAYITEHSSARLDQVLLTLGSLYQLYSQMAAEDAQISQAMCASLERRWKSTDQDVFLLAVFLNPYIRADLFNKQTTSGEFLCAGVTQLIIRVWKRLFRQSSDPDSIFLKACSDYYTRNYDSTFSDSAMNLALLERVAHSEGHEVDIRAIWEQLDDSTFIGRNWLVKLAIRVLSVVANSAGCERLFSQMGRVHTQYRSRLDPQSVRDIIVLKKALLHEFEDEKERSTRLKRKFSDYESRDCLEVGMSVDEEPGVEATLHARDDSRGELEVDSEDRPDAAMHDEPEGFYTKLARRFTDEVTADTMAERDAELPSLAGGGSSGSRNGAAGTYGRPAPIPLSLVFKYPTPANMGSGDTNTPQARTSASQEIQPKGVDMYWIGGLRSLAEATEQLARFQADYSPGVSV